MSGKLINLTIVFTIFIIGCAEPPKSQNIIISDSEIKNAGYEKIVLHIRSEQGLAPVVKVFPWLKNGSISKDSFIHVESEDGNSREVPYNEKEGCYYDYIISSPQKTYKLSIQKKNFSKSIKFSFTHKRLSTAVQLLLFTDSLNNSVLKGETLKSNSIIYIAWTIDKQANEYKVNIFKGGELCYYLYCETGYCFLEPKTLLGGDYSLIVESIFQDGDKDFITHPYYSISSFNSSSFLFRIE